jgi:hypothetical protein
MPKVKKAKKYLVAKLPTGDWSIIRGDSPLEIYSVTALGISEVEEQIRKSAPRAIITPLEGGDADVVAVKRSLDSPMCCEVLGLRICQEE